MRVINDQPPHSNKARLNIKWTVILATVFIAAIVGYVAYLAHPEPVEKKSPAAAVQNNNLQIKSTGTTTKTFTGQQFHELYERFVYPNTAPINESTPITGNEAADKTIRKIAVARGYALRSAPVTDAFQEVEPGMKLQQRAAQPWLDLKAEAKKDRVNIGLTAAYRSADDQRQIFVERLTQTGVSPEAIATGSHDSQVSQVLRMTAIPGYSRHHTGYTVDISCEDQPTISFEYTSCFKWLSANNYERTKKYGWIPSYPEGSGPQGPDPETWEYVWVGLAPLTQ